MWAANRRPPFCWTDWRGWNTGAMTPPAWRCGPRRQGLQVQKDQGPAAGARGPDPRRRGPGGDLGIGHTRWATHGEPNDINAHPHVSENGRIALVHNGIIENYLEIKEHLHEARASPSPPTRTPRWWPSCWSTTTTSATTCWRQWAACLRRIEGSYAFGIICADYPNALIAARKDSPLILGYGENGNFIASDVTAIIKYTRDVAYMDDGEIAVLTADSIDVFDDELMPVEKEHSHGGLGRVRGGEGRLSPLHVQGDHGAAGGHPQDRLSPHPGRPGGAGRPAPDGGLCPGHLPDLHHRLRLLLPCGHGQQVQLGEAAAPAGGGGAGLASSATATRWWTKRPW